MRGVDILVKLYLIIFSVSLRITFCYRVCQLRAVSKGIRFLKVCQEISLFKLTMYKFVYLTICFALFRASNAGKMPLELQKVLGIVDGPEETEPQLGDLLEDQKSKPRAFEDKPFDLNKYISQSPSNMASIETARSNLRAGDIEMYMPAKITAVECHVEFQVTERVPGRCTRLAGSIPACQAEKYVGINYNECS